jgi:uncharacterized protein YcaQ
MLSMLNRQHVASIQLSTLGLLTPPSSAPTKSDLLRTIRQIGILQIDTINVVNRSPYLVPWSRLGTYDPTWLEEIHKDGDLFEYWAHASSFIPIEDYPLFRRKMVEQATHWWPVSDWVNNNQDMIDFVMETIKEKGPQKASDFPKRTGDNQGWWDWKDEKIALDLLWTRGDLMIPFRKNFQRYYDLRENVIDYSEEKDIPDLRTVNEKLVEKTIKILGATREKWVADYYRLKKTEVRTSIQSLIEQKHIFRVESKDFPEGILIHVDNQELIEQTIKGNLNAENTTLQSPFDPLIWDRVRTKELFDFDFTLECYLPAPKRKFGYFSLPILHNGQLIGRMDSKAHRKEKIFEIKSLHFEPWFRPDQLFFNEFSKVLRNFAEWHQTPEIEVSKNVDPNHKKFITSFGSFQ